MRALLFIPVLVLFLSNVPFIQRIPLEKAIAMMQDNEICGEQNECSRNNENLEANCTLEESGCDIEESGCDISEAEESTVQDPASDDCCQKTETTCVCICCFQFAAPIQIITEFQFKCSTHSNTSTLYIVGHVKDPHIGAPWQPPDLV